MIEILKKAALAGAKVQMEYFGKKHLHETANKKSNQDIVTIADKKSQKAIEEAIIFEMTAKGFQMSDIGFIGEEDLESQGEYKFVIDPIDGTSNFSVGLEDFAVMIAYFIDTKLTAGLLYFPAKKHWYYSEVGKGAWVEKNGTKTRIKKEEVSLKDTVIFTSVSYDSDFENKIDEIIKKLYHRFRAVRMLGCAGSELMFLAEHIGGLVVGSGTSIWDIAPSKLIVEEAGYKFYDLEGKDLVFDLSKSRKKYPFFACNPKYKNEILEVIHSVRN